MQVIVKKMLFVFLIVLTATISTSQEVDSVDGVARWTFEPYAAQINEASIPIPLAMVRNDWYPSAFEFTDDYVFHIVYSNGTRETGVLYELVPVEATAFWGEQIGPLYDFDEYRFVYTSMNRQERSLRFFGNGDVILMRYSRSNVRNALTMFLEVDFHDNPPARLRRNLR